MVFIFVLCVLFLFVYFYVNFYSFCFDSEFSKNILGIGSIFKTELYG